MTKHLTSKRGLPKQRAVLVAVGLCAVLSFPFTVQAQQVESSSAATPAAANAATALPRLVRFSATAKDLNGSPLTGVVGITFALYSEPTGGAALWLETQNVTADSNGRYTALLGSTKPDGLPTDLFNSGQARWVGAQVSGQAEQPRVLLVSAPYALKAGDAETIGGLPPSAFVLANSSQSKTESAAASSAATAKTAESQSPQANPAVTGKGKIGYVPMWDSTSDIIDSLVFQKTTDVGIGTTTPAATLDVNGKSDVRDTLTLFPKGTDSTLAVNGTTFKIDQTGKVTFIASQTFPGAGTVTSVASGAGLKGGPITTTGTLSIANAGVTNAMLAHSSLTLTPGGGMTGGGSVALGGSTTLGLKTCSANQVLEFISGAWACASAGTGTITGVTAGSGLAGGGSSGNVALSLLTSCSASQILQWNGSTWVCASVTTGSITGVTAGTDLTGGGTSGNVTLNLDTTKVPQLAAANVFSNNNFIGGNGGSSYALNVFPPTQPTSSGLAGTPAAQIVGGSADPNGLKAGGTGLTAFGGDGGDANVSGNGGDAIDANGGTGNGGGGGAGISANGGFGNVLNGGDGVIANGGESSSVTGGNGVTATGGAGGATDMGHAGNGVVGVGGGSDGGGGGDGSGGIFTGGSNAFAGFGIEGYAGSGGAGFFSGDIIVTGAISAGTKDFKIDHPIDPANKYLYHASVESSEMIDIYSGNVTSDAQGDAQIRLPDWFEAVNADFRYQLTVIGQFAQAVVSRKVGNHQFAIKTDKPNVEVSWQITGVRQDAFAKAHPLVVEQAKNEHERGFYLHPELYGAPAEKGIAWAYHPETMRRMKAMQQRPKNAAPRKPTWSMPSSVKAGPVQK